MFLQEIWDYLCFFIWDTIETTKIIAYILWAAIQGALN